MKFIPADFAEQNTQERDIRFLMTKHGLFTMKHVKLSIFVMVYMPNMSAKVKSLTLSVRASAYDLLQED